MNSIKKMEYNGLRARIIIKSFKTNDAMHKFLNSQYDNKWSEATGEIEKPGTYAFVGGNWRNIKELDPCLLAHV